jgi:transposase
MSSASQEPAVSLSQVAEWLSFPGDAGLGVLLPHLAGMVVDKTVVSGDAVFCWVRSRAGGAACPGCGTWSAKVHDSYVRRLADAGIGGRRVVLFLRARLLACGSPECPKGTFAERAEGLARPRARKTAPLAGALGWVAAALAGRAGARLARAVLAVEVSRHLLVRLLMAAPEPLAGLVRVLGVDDFSLKKGQSYATVLVDMEAGVPVDVLPDREAATLEAWLRAHPGTEVICRDRAGAYAEAVRNAAPGAVQVADRWHLWHNLCEHARDAVARHRDCLAGHCRCQDPAGQPERGEREEKERREQDRAAAALEPAALEAAIRQRHAEVAQLRAAGLDLPAAAAKLGLSRQVTGQYWHSATAGALLGRLRPAPGLDRWKPWLRAQWAAGNTSVTALHAAVTADGYHGSYDTVRGYLTPFRLAAPPRPPAPPQPRQVTGWITSPPGKLGSDQAAALAALTARCPDLAALHARVAAFAKILTGREGKHALDAWLATAAAGPAQPELASFAHGIRLDYQAVVNGLTLPWSSGRVEGLNTRTKLLKRQMYGRATFPLLRKRILLTSKNTTP